jgi:NAD(P)-dependent dehydrogenase (short-subunit alcohol dehydrogenase family)
VEGLTGKVAVVTGGASGLGAGMVRSFVAAGLKVVVADLLERQGRLLADELGPACIFQRTDLRSDEDLDALLATAQQRFAGLDFLFNVACSYAEEGLQTSRSGWHQVFDINLFGHALLIQKALPYLVHSQAASIVNFSSASGHIAQMGRWVYPATKAAIEQMTRSAALELADQGIRVNAILPGLIGKPSHEYASEEAAQRIAGLADRFNMFSRLQTAEEVAEAALFLCSSHARFITGACLAVDGGYTALGPQGKERHVPRRG